MENKGPLAVLAVTSVIGYTHTQAWLQPTVRLPKELVDPMEHYAQLGETLSRITAASTPASLWASVKDYVGRFGYTHLLAIDAAKLVGGIREAALYADTPGELMSTIDRELVYEQHPVVQRALKCSTPFLVSEMRAEPLHRNQRWTQLMVDAVRNGDGLVLPIHKGDDPVAGLNLGGERPDTTGLARSLLHIVGHAAVDRAFELREGKRPSGGSNLSVRETQCLRYVAIGYPDAEIGRILGISPRTVRFHVDSAKAKLGVSTRVQAVAKALREHVIAV